MCTVDLFPVPEDMYGASSPASLASPRSPPYPSPPYMDALESSGYAPMRSPLTYYPLHPYTSLDASGSGQVEGSSSPFDIPRRQPMLGYLHHTDRPSDTVHQVGNHLITESSKLTPALVGERFTEPTLVDYQGRKALIFVFGVSGLTLGPGSGIWDVLVLAFPLLIRHLRLRWVTEVTDSMSAAIKRCKRESSGPPDWVFPVFFGGRKTAFV